MVKRSTLRTLAQKPRHELVDARPWRALSCRALCSVVAAACLAMVWPSVAEAQIRPSAPSLTSTQRAEVDRGEILVDVTVSGNDVRGKVIAVVDGTPAGVWAIISDFANQDRWIPDMYDARIVERDGHFVIGEASTTVPWPLTDRTWRIRIHNREMEVGGVNSYVSSWTYVQGNMDENTGYWLVQPFNDAGTRALVVYEFHANAGIRAPDGMQRRTTRRLMPGIIEGLRSRYARLN